MYKKTICAFILLSLILLYGTVCVDGAALEKQLARKAADLKWEQNATKSEPVMIANHAMGIIDTAISDQRVVQLQRVDRPAVATAWQGEDMELLLRIVEAEAGNQDEDGRLLVANVVLNRVASEAFPDTIKDVVLQEQDGNYQFSPVANGRIWKVKVTGATERAVERALSGEDISDGALYFVARQYADSSSVRWFDNHLTYLFEWGDHEFFK